MAENSKIEWTDHTFNPWIGCTKVSPACDNCYAEAMMDTATGGRWGAGEPIASAPPGTGSSRASGTSAAQRRVAPVRVLRLACRRVRQ
jgi:protein gp37